jgi:hypothetical protein
LGFQRLSAGSLLLRDSTGAESGALKPADSMVSAGYALDVAGWSLGASLKWVECRVVDSAWTLAGDVGLLSPVLAGDRLRLSAAVVNLGGKIRFQKEAEELPSALRLGGSWRTGSRSILALDGAFPRDGGPSSVALGAERRLMQGESSALSLRAGYRLRQVRGSEREGSVTLGFGLDARGLGLDYSLLPGQALGNAHRASLSFTF